MATRFGDMIRMRRHERRLTLEDVSDQVGVTPGALSHIESGRRLPSPPNAIAIGQVLGIARDDVLMALDHEHSQRRRDSLSASEQVSFSEPDYSEPAPAAPKSRSKKGAAYTSRPIGDLFPDAPADANVTPLESASMSRGLMHRMPQSDSRSWRDQARWANDTVARFDALSQLSDTAAEAIRTLRGALGDEDPDVRREARRLLLELDVRLPEE
jgi:transcriptional regulator with XRE-family HTH domain